MSNNTKERICPYCNKKLQDMLEAMAHIQKCRRIHELSSTRPEFKNDFKRRLRQT